MGADDPAEPAGPRGVPHLEIVKGPLPTGKRIIRLQQGMSILGRALDVDLLFDAEGVSRKHAKLSYSDDGTVTFYDLGSTNGSFVNGRQAEIVTLQDGDELRIGTVLLRFGRRDPRKRQADGATGGGRNPFDQLSAREREIARLVANGLTNAEVGKALHISARTVGTHLSRIFAQLELKNRTELARLATEWDMAKTDIV
jgi:DNA-binding CsgD family transcriptional regulator